MRKRQRDWDGAPEHENGNESDMDLELLVESESDSEEERGGPPVLPEDRPRRPAAEEYNPPPLSDVCVVSRVLYSEDESSSGDEEIEENLVDQLEDEEEMDDLEEGDHGNAQGARSGLDTRVRAGGFLGNEFGLRCFLVSVILVKPIYHLIVTVVTKSLSLM